MSLDPAGLSKPLAKCGERQIRSGRAAADVADYRHRLLLRGQTVTRRNRAGHQQQQLAAVHSMISSTRARIDGVMVSPRALAVLRLTTSSKIVGCWTGKSAGLAPLRICPT